MTDLRASLPRDVPSQKWIGEFSKGLCTNIQLSVYNGVYTRLCVSFSGQRKSFSYITFNWILFCRSNTQCPARLSRMPTVDSHRAAVARLSVRSAVRSSAETPRTFTYDDNSRSFRKKISYNGTVHSIRLKRTTYFDFLTMHRIRAIFGYMSMILWDIGRRGSQNVVYKRIWSFLG